MDEAAPDPVEGEARIRIEGGLAHFPGLAREQVIRFCDLPPGIVDDLVQSAGSACFFEQPDSQPAARPDARTYTLGLTIAGRSHQARLSEPIENPHLAELVSTVRKLARQQASPGGIPLGESEGQG